jgi:putative ATP-binding cassette transporter
MQIAQVFGNVQSALSWIVTAYPDIVSWRATVKRLHDFDAAIGQAIAAQYSPLRVSVGGATLRTQHLDVSLPSGERILSDVALDIERGTPVAVTGPAGIGKSTLFRTLAGIWPYASGDVEQPAGTILFLPQRPYLPLGSLKHAVAYPHGDDTVSDAAVRDALARVGLQTLAADLDVIDNWSLRLSGGEQQRLALARALVVAPDWLFLDEALSALDVAGAHDLFDAVRKALPAAQIVSITHDGTLTALHERRIAFDALREARSLGRT